MDHQVAVWPELSMVNWMVSDLSRHKVGCANNTPSSNHIIICVWALGSSEGTSKLCEVALMYMVPSPSDCHPSPARLHGKFPIEEEVEGGRRALGLFYRWCYIISRHYLKVNSCSTTTLSGTSLKDGSEGKSSQEAELQAVYLVVHSG